MISNAAALLLIAVALLVVDPIVVIKARIQDAKDNVVVYCNWPGWEYACNYWKDQVSRESEALKAVKK